MKSQSDWPVSIAHSIWICIVVLTLFYIWFALANRYSIFLYTHLGAEPFDPVTRSRYWMAGLVASGLILVMNAALNWVLGRLNESGYLTCRPPRWQQIWLICAAPLALGILSITMTQNWPTLPLGLALITAGVTLIGLALALPAGALAAQQPAKLIWLTLYGFALMPLLLVFHAVELPSRDILTESTAQVITALSLIASTLVVAGLDSARKRLGKARLNPVSILVAGLNVNYLFLPLVHHLLATPPAHRYITTAGNFFAYSPTLQVTTWLLAALMVIGLDRLIFQTSLHMKESQ